MLEQLEHFLKDLEDQGVEVWLAGLRPDLITAMHRLKFDEWFPEDRLRPHGAEDYSATLAAIRDIRNRLPVADEVVVGGPKLYYLV